MGDSDGTYDLALKGNTALHLWHPVSIIPIKSPFTRATVKKNPNQITKGDLQYVLSMQLDGLVAKETGGLINGQ